MSLINPGIDTGHIKQMALRAKTLGQLGREENAYRAKFESKTMRNPISVEYKTPFEKPVYSDSTLDEIREFCKGKSADEIHTAMGKTVRYFKNGKKMLIGDYGWPLNHSGSFRRIGVDEKELLKDVVVIQGNCDLIASDLKDLGEVRVITGRLHIPYFTKLKDVSSLESVGSISKCTENLEDTLKLFKRIKFNPKEIKRVGKLYPEEYITMDILNGVKTTATEALKSIAASKIY